MDSIPWVHHSREEGYLDYNGGFVRLQIHMNFDTIIHRQQELMLLYISATTQVVSAALVVEQEEPRRS
jgi:hypothetical protein